MLSHIWGHWVRRRTKKGQVQGCWVIEVISDKVESFCFQCYYQQELFLCKQSKFQERKGSNEFWLLMWLINGTGTRKCHDLSLVFLAILCDLGDVMIWIANFPESLLVTRYSTRTLVCIMPSYPPGNPI